jgi:hypothetical protein
MNILHKIKRKLWQKTVSRLRNTLVYYTLYKSYWHYKLTGKEIAVTSDINYFAQIPNLGAGIGHQLANWISGFYFARFFNLNFAHAPFSNPDWEDFFGFGKGELSLHQVIKDGYKRVRLPLFDENNDAEVNMVKAIIASYSTKKVVFTADEDQFYAAQYGVIDDLQAKFYNSNSRIDNKLLYNPDFFNIAIHVRRGDITIGQLNKNPNLLMRWQDNDYFKNVLLQALNMVKTNKPIHIYLFSQGNPEDFKEFEAFENLNLCLDMGARDSFLHMVYADLLITSKSSFSYKPALLNKNIKISPKNFWHGYPESDKWILAEEIGTIDHEKHFDEKQIL